MVLRRSFYLGMPNLVTCHGVVAPELCIFSYLLLGVFTELISIFSRFPVLLLLCQCGGKARTYVRPSVMASEKTLIVAFCCSKRNLSSPDLLMSFVLEDDYCPCAWRKQCSKGSLVVSQAAVGLLEQAWWWSWNPALKSGSSRAMQTQLPISSSSCRVSLDVTQGSFCVMNFRE